jgi:transglutaminase-like putative cysteine protease
VTTLAAPRPAVAPSREPASGPALFPLPAARGAMLVALATFGGLHWMAMFEPGEPDRAWLGVVVGALAVLGLLGAGRLDGALRYVAAALVAVAAVALALLAGGAADEQLRPDHWSGLLSEIGRGMETLPGVRVPYRGVDEATRLTMGVGGTVLIAAAALLAFWPGRARLGFPHLALILLVTLYATPAVVMHFGNEFLRGALLALLMLAFLRLETLRVREAGPAAALAAAAAVVALMVAPALDGSNPWWDYESWAVDTAKAQAVTFNWNHDYSPLTWPRDGRELLRVQARIPSYWKARNLDVFDGHAWRADTRGRGEDVFNQLPDDLAELDKWTQEIKVTLRNLRTQSFVTAGVAMAIRDEQSFPLGGGVFASSDGLGKGAAYKADVYTPRPTVREMRGAGTSYEDWTRSYRSIIVPLQALPSGDESGSEFLPFRVTWAPLGTSIRPEAERINGARVPLRFVLTGSGLERIYTLAKDLRKGAETPYDYMANIEQYLSTGFAYSESPPKTAETLDGFLLDAKIGFCQQYSGAMALLLRMGGVPARVATGFSTGSYDEDDKEYVVRDLDAHSWVEAWFPGIGWVTRDPTPASAPARSQPGDANQTSGGGSTPHVPDLGGDRLDDLASNRAKAAADSGLSTPVIVLLALAGLLAVSAAVTAFVLHRRLPPPAQRPMAEFERALRRARYDGGPGLTLTRMERRFQGWPGAAGYVRALREQRYSGRAAEPTSEQRRGLRAALARDAGVLRSWWALPPRWR